MEEEQNRVLRLIFDLLKEEKDMKKFFSIILIGWVLSFVGIVYSQIEGGRVGTGFPLSSGGRISSFLDPTKFSMGQSYSVMFSSDGRRSRMTSLYLNSLSYKLSPSLLLRVDLGYRFNPIQPNSSERSFLPGANILWMPNEHFILEMNYSTFGGIERYSRP